MDAGLPAADAFVIQGDRILAVGAEHELGGLVGRGDRRVNLRGQVVVPGLIDAHVHFSLFSFGLVDVSLEGAQSIEEAVSRVRDRAMRTPGGTWIRGHGFNANLWERWPTARELDRVAPLHPVILTSKDVHSVWVNSLAMQMARVTVATPDPPGGRILRDEHGQLTGVFQENAAELIWRVVPQRTQEEYQDALKLGIREAHRQGVTGVHDMDSSACFRALQALQAQGELTLRVYKQIQEEAFRAALAAGLTTGFGNEWLRVGCLKLFADGSLGSQTAAMLHDYEGRPGYRGVATHTPEELDELIERAVRADMAVAVHAIGDAANRVVLDAFERVAALSWAKGLRHRIEHAQLLTPYDLPRLAELGIIASVQPSHAPDDRYLAEQHWGPERSRMAYAFKSLLGSGARLALGSDVPVAPLDPLAGIHAAVWRKRMDEPESQPWFPGECLTVAEALYGFTLGAAYASGEERIKGSITPGKLADFVVLTHDISGSSEEVLKQVRPQATVVGGRLVYGEW